MRKHSAAEPQAIPAGASRRPAGSRLSSTTRRVAASAAATTGTFSRNTARRLQTCTSGAGALRRTRAHRIAGMAKAAIVLGVVDLVLFVLSLAALPSGGGWITAG